MLEEYIKLVPYQEFKEQKLAAETFKFAQDPVCRVKSYLLQNILPAIYREYGPLD